MTSREQELVDRIEKDIVEAFRGEGSGHDHYHILRVRGNARRILQAEGEGDPFRVEAASLLHDVGDAKFFRGDTEKGERRTREWLASYELSKSEKADLLHIIRTTSFKGRRGHDTPGSVEGRVVQDADRLDAMGAIGIARTFAFGGNRGSPLHIPEEDEERQGSGESGPTIAHFHEKLLHLRDRMKTKEGRRIAEERHRFMLAFLDRFHLEWNGAD